MKRGTESQNSRNREVYMGAVKKKDAIDVNQLLEAAAKSMWAVTQTYFQNGALRT